MRSGIFDSQYEYACGVLNGDIIDERFLPIIYELDDPAEWDKPEMWVKANPGIGSIKSTQYLKEMVEKAKADPSFKSTVLVKDFNLKQTSESAWLTFEETKSAEVDIGDYKWDYLIGGFDAADTTDLNAACAILRDQATNISTGAQCTGYQSRLLKSRKRQETDAAETASRMICGSARATCEPTQATR